MNVHPIKTILTRESWRQPLETIAKPVHHQMDSGCIKSSTKNLTHQHISWLWIQLTSIYGPLFIHKHGSKDNGLWLEILNELTPLALESGLERIKKLSAGDKFAEYPPNCLQFKALCLAFYEDLKLPKASDAYREIRNKAYTTSIYWSHSAVSFTAQRLPLEFLSLRDTEAYPCFKAAYEDVCHLIRQGHALPNLPDRVMVSSTSNKELAKKSLQQMKHQLGAC